MAGIALGASTSPVPRTSPPSRWCSRPGRRRRPISCCHSSGSRRKRWSYAAVATMFSTMCGNGRASSTPPRATWFTMALSKSLSRIWGSGTTLRRSPLTAGMLRRWYRTWRTWALPWSPSVRAIRICPRPPRSYTSC